MSTNPNLWEEKYVRTMDQLTEQERGELMEIREVDDITEIVLLDTWHDDGIECAGVRLNGVEFGFWCVGETGMFVYAGESKTAKDEVLQQLLAEIRGWQEDQAAS